MHLESLFLTQFRNYAEETLELSGSALHLFIGPNGSGKTNLLEAISVLSLTRSCLQTPEEDLRQWGKDFYRLKAVIKSDTGPESTLEITSQVQPRKAKACFINDVRVSASDIIGTFPVVLFLPQDLELFTGAPALRRSFLDIILSQVSPEYFQDLSQYQKLLKQRNALLRQIAQGSAQTSELTTWDRALSEKGSHITTARLELVETFNLTLSEEVRALGEQWQDVTMQYERGTQERSEEALAKELRQMLLEVQDRDILLQSTTIGPHRDDWSIVADGHDIARTASRGQQRVCVLALLLLEASYLELRRSEKPVILLDDIFSELDTLHQKKVLGSLSNHQVLITALHVPELLEDSQLWTVKSGSIEKAEPAYVTA